MQEIGYVATIGMFDGVHRGHQFVLQHVADEARQRGLQSMAITFDKSGPQTLTPLNQKRLLLTKTGIDRIEVLTFNEALKQMTAREFMETTTALATTAQRALTTTSAMARSWASR